MLTDLEGRILNLLRSRLGRVLRASAVYLLVAVALLAELSLVKLYPEDDAVLIIGVILLTMALAIWLRFLFLFPAVVLAWFVPPSVRDAVLGDEPMTLALAMALVGQLYLAGVTRFAYRALGHNLFGDRDQVAAAQIIGQELELQDALLPDAQTPREHSKPPLPCGAIITRFEADSFLERLISLDHDLRLNGEVLRATLRRSIGLMKDQQVSANVTLGSLNRAGRRDLSA